MPMASCRWCLKLIKMPPDYNPKGKLDAICSPACVANERAFMVMFSDEHIGLRNLQEHGINPNDRGKKK